MFLPQNPTYDYICYIGIGAASLIGAGISAVGSLFGNGSSYRNNKKLLDRQNAYNVQMADTAYQRDLDMWNRQNAYNSLSEQVERLKAAGLNPNLIYGNGSASVGNASDSPSYNAPMSDINRYQGDFGIQDAANSVTNGINQYVQTKIGLAQANNLQSSTALNNLKAIGQEINNAKDDITRSRLQEVYDAQLRALDNEAINAMANARLSDERAITEKNSRELQLDMMREKVNQLKFTNSLQPQQKELLVKNLALLQQRIIHEVQENSMFDLRRRHNELTNANLMKQFELRLQEKDINQVLIDSGINLKGGIRERVMTQLMELISSGATIDQMLPYIFMGAFK